MNNLYYNESQYPEKLEIYYSKASITLGYILALGLFVFGFFLIVTKNPLGVFLILISLFVLYSNMKKKKDIYKIQLSISNKQISFKGSKTYKWQNISDEKVEEIQSGKSSITHLTFYYNGRKVLINVQDLDFDSKQLETALKVYRKRFESSISQ